MSHMSFDWRGVSSADHGVVVTRLPPITLPGRRTQTAVVPGRSGALHIWDGAWDEVLMTVECYLPYEQGAGVSPPETLAAWLTGEGWLTLSNRPGRRFRARLTDSVGLAAWVEGFADRIFSLPFWADPFGYEAAPTAYTRTEPFDLVNPGSVFAMPLIQLNATGDISLTIGEKTADIAGVPAQIDALPGPITIDVAAGLVYKGETNLTGYASTDDWPLSIPVGISPVSWTGNVTQLTIQPNWRWL